MHIGGVQARATTNVYVGFLGTLCVMQNVGGLGFKNLFGFNVALLGKHVWKYIQSPVLLVSRVLKSKYFLDVHITHASKDGKASFIWTSISQVKEYLVNGFRWVIEDGQSVVATQDPWLAQKADFMVDKLQMYEGRDEKVATLFHPGTKFWDADKVRGLFSISNSNAILATSVPQRQVVDRMVWSKSIDGLYNVKTGYKEWHNQVTGNSISTQSGGWSRLWRLAIPHKIQIFV